MRRRLAVAAVVVGLVSAACGAASDGGTTTTPPATSAPTTLPAPSEDAAADLAAARARWAEAGMDSYRYTFINRCNECDPALAEPYDVNVYGGRTLPGAQPGRTVEGLFAAIADAIDDELTTLIDYAPDTGVPTHIVIDPESFPTDGGTEWVVDDFRIGSPGVKLDNAEVEAALATWRSLGITGYSFTEHIFCDCSDAGTTAVDVANGAVADAGSYSDRELFPVSFDELLEALVLFNDESDELGTVSLDYLVRLDPTYGYVSWIWVDAVLDDGEVIEFVMQFDDFVPSETAPNADADVREAREQWERAGYDDYEYTLSVNCFCPEEFRGPFLVRVSDGAVTDVTRNGEPVDVPDAYSIDQLLDLIELTANQGKRIAVTYSEIGAPMSVQLDLDAIAVDGGTSLEVSDLTPLLVGNLAEEVKRAQTLWELAGIETYTVHYLFACECPGGNISVRVVDGIVESAEFSNASASDEVLDGLLYPVHRMFAAIVDGIERGAHSIEADFHPDLGYPTSIVIDYDRDTADEELIIVDITVEAG